MRNTITSPNLTWIDIEDPKEEDVEYLRKNFDFHPLVLGEILPPGHRPKVEPYENYLFLILYYPRFDEQKRETIAQELDIIVTQDAIISSHYFPVVTLKSIFDQCNLYEEKRTEMMQNSAQLLYFIIKIMWDATLAKVTPIEQNIDSIERSIFSGREKEMVSEIALIKKDILDFRRIIRPQKLVIESLQTEGEKFFGKDFSHFMHDILGTYGKMENALETHKETIEALEKTNESLLTTKINATMQILTVISTIILPLSLIANIWGMNTTYLPMAGEKFDFSVISVIMFVSLIIMFVIFRVRKII